MTEEEPLQLEVPMEILSYRVRTTTSVSMVEKVGPKIIQFFIGADSGPPKNDSGSGNSVRERPVFHESV